MDHPPLCSNPATISTANDAEIGRDVDGEMMVERTRSPPWTACPRSQPAMRQAIVLSTPCALPYPPVFADLSRLVAHRFQFLAKIEAFNPAGSIKLKPALGLIEALANEGRLRGNSIIIDTSSGNMAIALSLAARARDLSFMCVTDEKITPHNRRLIEAYGGEVRIMERSTHRERCQFIETLEAADKRYVWTRQFQDWRNVQTHEDTTALEIFETLPHVDAIFVGVGTGGTIAGCAKIRDERFRHTRIVAVDPAGSNHFPRAQPPPATQPPIVRRIPGIGATERSAFLDSIKVDEVCVVSDSQTVATCLDVLSQTGWLLGGSSGSVIHAVVRAAPMLPADGVIVAICADSGERYLDTIYDTQWRARFIDPDMTASPA